MWRHDAKCRQAMGQFSTKSLNWGRTKAAQLSRCAAMANGLQALLSASCLTSLPALELAAWEGAALWDDALPLAAGIVLFLLLFSPIKRQLLLCCGLRKDSGLFYALCKKRLLNAFYLTLGCLLGPLVLVANVAREAIWFGVLRTWVKFHSTLKVYMLQVLRLP